MKLFLGFLLGLGTAWAALAIWQRVPEFPDIDEMDDLDRVVYLGEDPPSIAHGTAPWQERPYAHLNNRFPVVLPPYYSNEPAPRYSE